MAWNLGWGWSLNRLTLNCLQILLEAMRILLNLALRNLILWKSSLICIVVIEGLIRVVFEMTHFTFTGLEELLELLHYAILILYIYHLHPIDVLVAHELRWQHCIVESVVVIFCGLLFLQVLIKVFSKIGFTLLLLQFC